MQFQIIIPVKNELKNLKILLPILVKKYKYNILIIDKSEDSKRVKKFCLRYKNVHFFSQVSNGKGNALNEAAKLSKATILIFFDADCSHNPDDISKFINIFKLNPKIDHIGGSRMRGGSDELFSEFTHLLRLFGSLIINLVISLKFNAKITDSQNGFRLIKKKIFLKCRVTSKHTSIETELVGKTLSKGFFYREVPTHEWVRKFGVSKINLLKHSWAYIAILIKILFMKKPKINSFIKYDESWFKKK